MACRGSVIALFLVGALLIPHIAAQKGCNQACSSNDDCAGQLACINGKCNDDPDVGTHICAAAPPPPQGTGTCKPSGSITSPTVTRSMCDPSQDPCCQSGKKYNTYDCSPPITSPATSATLTVNNFTKGGDGGGPSECTGQYYDNSQRVVALSTGWFNNMSRCGKTIQINGNGKSTTAIVVDECDSRHGCDAEHAYQVPCATNIVDASDAVWKALGVSSQDSRYGYMTVTWSQLN